LEKGPNQDSRISGFTGFFWGCFRSGFPMRIQWENGFCGFSDGNGFFLRKGTGFPQKIPKKIRFHPKIRKIRFTIAS
jgi:hypothetical protein